MLRTTRPRSTLLAVALLTLTLQVVQPARPAAAVGLRALAPRGFVLGTAVSDQPSALANTTYRRLTAQHFSSVTPDMAFKWGIIHPAPRVWSWERADRAVATARANGQRVRGNALLWDGVPGYVRSQVRTCTDARRVLKEHITTVVTHFRGRVAEWDVVNEPFDPSGRLTRENPFLVACGESIIADAFRWAHASDPSARLFLNEDDTLTATPRAASLYALVKRLRTQRVPIEGVGFESHWQLVDGVPTTAGSQLARYTRLGLAVAITEADVRMRVPASGARPTTGQLALQSRVYSTLVDACLDQPRCTGVTVWGFTDRWSWVSSSLPGQGRACLMDERFVPRPAWGAVDRRLRLGR